MTRDAAEKHREIITAFMNGAEIQTSWGDGEWHDEDRPSFCTSVQYRIKPTPPKPMYRPYADPSEVDRVGEIAEYRNGDHITIGIVWVDQCTDSDKAWFFIGNKYMKPEDAQEHATYRRGGAPCAVKVEE